MADGSDDGVLTVEIKNSRPVELIDLTVSLSSLAESFKDYANEAGDPIPDNIRLYVRELRSGSIIAELTALAEQAQWVLEHAEVLAGFVSNTQEVINYFLGRETKPGAEPTRRQAQLVSGVMNPVAKDTSSQINITINGPVTINQITVNSLEANALQNSVSRFLGPSLPAAAVYTDQLMVLEQVKNDAKARTGDRGVIETISHKPVKLRFMSDEAKRKVLDLEGNPFQSVFLVDVDVRSVEGSPTLYQILEVKDVMAR